MAADQDPKIRLELELSLQQTGLLEGLDHWLQLGLISNQQVRTLCQEQLSCALPPAIEPVPLNPTTPVFPVSTAASTEPDLAPEVVMNPFEAARAALASEAAGRDDFLPYSEDSQVSQPAQPLPGQPDSAGPAQADILQSRSTDPRRISPPPARSANQGLNRLVSELSVVWLLGLGVFLVVLSSAVLAATQWARFNAVGQYLVLLAYTLVFWGIGLGSSRNPHLQLTSRTLQMITLLLVPLNFWAMDGLGVWGTAGGFLVAGVSALLLTLATWQVMGKQQTSTIKRANVLGLAYLHTGWGWGAVPVLAIYAGVLGSAAATVTARTAPAGLHSSRGPNPAVPVLEQASSPGTAPLPPAALGRWSTLGVFFALGLLLLRGLSVLPENEWGQLGLAMGLYGATWVWLGQRQLGQPQAPSPSPAALPRGSTWLGRGLLWWGWLIAIDGVKAQAFGVSLLGLGLRLQTLQKLGRRRDLLVGYGIAVQLAFVGWQLLPADLRQFILVPLSAWARSRGGSDIALLGISLLPYGVALVALGDWYRRRGQDKLGRFSDAIALGSSILLTGISAFSHPVVVVNLIASTITALVATWRRKPLRQWRILLSYGLVLATILVTLDYGWPDLSASGWLVVMMALAVMALLLSRGLPHPWNRGAEWYGFGLSALAYLLLGNHLEASNYQSSLSWLGLLIPLTLTVIGRHPASVLATGLTLPLTLGLPWTRLVGLGTATALTAINSVYHRHRLVAFMAIGLGLGFVVAVLADLVPIYPATAADWCVVTVGLLAALWLAWRWLTSAFTEEADQGIRGLYRNAADAWGHLLAVGLLVFISFSLGLLYGGFGEFSRPITGALVGYLLVLGGRYWGRVQPVAIYLAGWGIELLVAQVVAGPAPSTVGLALPTLGLGAIALLLATLLGRSRSALTPPLHGLTLMYAGLALLLRSTTATAWTGWLVVVASLLLLEVGRQARKAPLRWLALGGLSIGWYELVIYQLLQSDGGSQVDGIVVLAGVAVLIMGLYRLVAARLDRHLHLPQIELIWAAHLHWLVGSVLMLGIITALTFMAASLTGLGLAIATALVLYALLQGRLGHQNGLKAAWVYAGLVELVGWFALLRFTLPGLAMLDNWWGAVACAVAVPIYWVPWSRRGWPQAPWRVMAVAVPLVITALTEGFDHIPTLWILAGFYGWLAWHSRRVRVSYLSAGCGVLAIWIWLEQHTIQDNLAWVLPLGLTLLYVAQVDPALHPPKGKGWRHWLRLIAVGLILLTALFSDRWAGLPVGVMGLAAIAAGLLLRTRAFLYAGTVVFGLNALNQLIVLNSTYPFIKWILGILVGIGLIWIAADFERRRDQWVTLTQSWSQDLDDWQ